ncbi:hypothetical protein [Candidatus Marithrix sp. Canyon 246]|uniref:hypothetical protein n=1 Tax=Candidatus Marithrix sp. Canyon 246 TaxID=1827136 RepID=UPI000849F7B9|nr:hypothetical protein [Candidatus Marithrix sp. Canyon 246]
MYAVEFDATITNGILSIPEKYQELRNQKTARCIIMYNHPTSYNMSRDEVNERMDSVDMIFDKFQIDFSNYKFDRNEANAR